MRTGLLSNEGKRLTFQLCTCFRGSHVDDDDDDGDDDDDDACKVLPCFRITFMLIVLYA